MKKCKCGKPSEWAEEFCQECWEEFTGDLFCVMAEDPREFLRDTHGFIEREEKCADYSAKA